MQISYSQHAENQILERKISKKLIENTLNDPDNVVLGYGGRKVAQKAVVVDGKTFLLRVIYAESEVITVLTAYFTKLNRYGAEK